MRKRYELGVDNDNNDEFEDTGSRRNSLHSVPFYLGIAVLVYLALLYSSIFLIDNALPTPLTVGDEVNIILNHYF